MPFERVYIGDEPQFVPDLPGGAKQPVERGDTVTFTEAPNSPLFVTASEAKKAGVRARKPAEADAAAVVEEPTGFAEVTPSDGPSDDTAQEG